MAWGIHLDVTTDTVTRALIRLDKQGGDLAPFMRDVGAHWSERVALEFAGSHDPYGAPWKPLKYRKGQPLLDTGRLRNSITSRVSQRQLVVGTNVVYAKIHNEGGNVLRAPRSVMIRLKKRGSKLARQKGHKNLAVFAKNSAKNVRTSWHEARQYMIPIPARPFLPVSGLPRPWEDDIYRSFVRHMAMQGAA